MKTSEMSWVWISRIEKTEKEFEPIENGFLFLERLTRPGPVRFICIFFTHSTY